MHLRQIPMVDVEETQKFTIQLMIENDQEIVDFCVKYSLDIKEVLN